MLPQVEKTLRDLIAFDPRSQILAKDLQIVPKKPWYHYLLARFHSDAHTQQANRKLLMDIFIKEVRYDSKFMVQLYNYAVMKFNTVAKEWALDQFNSAKLRQLQNECLLPLVSVFSDDLLNQPRLCTPDRIQEYGLPFGCSHWVNHYPKIASFESRGGKVILLEHLGRQERYQPRIGVKDQEFICVCHAGLMRSPTAKLILTLLKNRLGFHHGQENIRPAHGICNGYDPYGKEERPPEDAENICLREFMEAFDRHRGLRYGKDLTKDEFIADYYGHDSGLSKPKIFITFADVGFTIIERLLLANPKSPLNGVTVVMIPDGDFISNCFIHPDMFFLFTRLIAKESAKPPETHKFVHDLTPSERRNVYWTVTGVCQPDRYFEEHLARYVHEINYDLEWDEELHSLMIMEGFRTAFWRWSGLFVPVKSHAN